MDEDSRDLVKVIVTVTLGLGFIISVVVALSMWASWYSAGIQRDVYERQGIHMTQWEVFMGAKPAKVVQP